ncbi:GreA/GreB family elongation factor [Symbiobacterium terraclitae]|uniref:GreA/GreB family elongation factor n=1 Tax=Symbiobacterium terraclitae TaxID=557451 RepID=UPI0035B55DF4
MAEGHRTRVRREYHSEEPIGAQIRKAGEEVDERAARAVAGPPVTEAEAEILAGSAHEPVQMYSTVVVMDLARGEQQRYRLVSEGEGDPERGEISLSSPLGRALLMEYPGAVVRVKAPGGERLYRILCVGD